MKKGDRIIASMFDKQIAARVTEALEGVVFASALNRQASIHLSSELVQLVEGRAYFARFKSDEKWVVDIDPPYAIGNINSAVPIPTALLPKFVTFRELVLHEWPENADDPLTEVICNRCSLAHFLCFEPLIGDEKNGLKWSPCPITGHPIILSQRGTFANEGELLSIV